MQSQDKLKIVMCADDPDTILSYGLLSKMLIDKWNKKYEIHYVSLQYPIGQPIDRGNYIKYPGHCAGERNPTYLPVVLQRINPHILWTNFDVQHYSQIHQYVHPSILWIGWLPWDNTDIMQVPHAQHGFGPVDVRVAISKFGYDFLNQNKVRVDDMIYNIVDTDAYYPLDEKSEEIENFKKANSWYNPDFKYILFVGRPNWRKRMAHLLAIFKELIDRGNTNYRLILHSNLDDNARLFDFRELVNCLGLDNYIINNTFEWDKGVPKEQLRVLYNIADLYLAPHGGEGFGMPIGESMACGTPFVASDYCTTREFAGPNNERGLAGPIMWPTLPNGQPYMDKGVFRPYPVIKEFANVVEGIMADENRRKAMGKNGVKWVRENCAPGVVASKWSNLLDTFNINTARVKEVD